MTCPHLDVEIESYGVALDGVTDDHTALQRAFVAAGKFVESYTWEAQATARVWSSRAGIARVSHSIGVPYGVQIDGAVPGGGEWFWRRDPG